MAKKSDAKRGRPPTESVGTRECPIMIRCTPAELAQIKRAAASDGRTVSGYVRAAVRRAIAGVL